MKRTLLRQIAGLDKRLAKVFPVIVIAAHQQLR
jgi:hypothetical protein